MCHYWSLDWDLRSTCLFYCMHNCLICFILKSSFCSSIYLAYSGSDNTGRWLAQCYGLELVLVAWISIHHWLVSLFFRLFVNSAEHHLPVFKGKPSQFILRELQTRNPESVLKDLRQQQVMISFFSIFGLFQNRYPI